MADAFWWWGIPAASAALCLVLVTADEGARFRAAPAARFAPAPAMESVRAPVLVQDAAGRRAGPVVLPTAPPEAIMLQLPPACTGERCGLALWRRDPAGAAVELWRAEPRVRADGCLPIGGLQPGASYDLEVRHAAVAPGGVRRLLGVVAGSMIDLAASR